ncbi:MAG: PHB depolymerase family esterase [Bacteroidetes bacterium]|nr:PHB depolymerase family esterase [Bacteroidota bacterium]
MFVHLPPDVQKNVPIPVVVVLHGCLQCAESVASQTGWNKLADEYGFYVVYPQQRIINNPMRCFKWYKRRNIYKNRGENQSIKHMVDYLKSNYAIDSSKIFITGLSAGAAMSVIMMANYPETFNAGAIFAGAPYKVATSSIPAMMAFFGWRIKTPEKWGSYVRSQNTSYFGTYPRMIIYQGNNDWIVNKRNGVELMKQWTNVHGISTIPSERIEAFLNNRDIERSVYRDTSGKDVVIFYKVNNLSHALLVDPGNCKYQGGKTGIFSKDKNYFSSLYTAYDLGLIKPPAISGNTSILPNEAGLNYAVPLSDSSTYEWSIPAGCTMVKNDKGNEITVKWNARSGCINVTETDSNQCQKNYQTLFVEVQKK